MGIAALSRRFNPSLLLLRTGGSGASDPTSSDHIAHIQVDGQPPTVERPQAVNRERLVKDLSRC